MLTELDDDFLYEEDKIIKSQMDENCPLLPIEALSFDITPICSDPSQPKMGDLIDVPSLLTPPEDLLKNESDDNTPTNICQENVIIDDNLLNDDLDITIVNNTCSSYEAEKYDLLKQSFELERLGMTVSTKYVVIIKDDSNLIGISIGGGYPLCPCLYIVQVFDGTPAAKEGSLESGDELLAINNVSVKGKTKVQVAKMIQAATQQVTIHYNKLHADPERGKSLDIILKKLKHRIVDNMSSNTADTLGFSRAILCNDSLVKRLEELEGTEIMYKGLVEHARRVLKAHYDLLQSYRAFGDCFMRISTREPQLRASETFRIFGEFHRNLEKDGLEIIKKIKPILDDLGTYLHKAIPDTKLTVSRYMDAKFTYLSYCLKVKEMDDEEHSFASIQEPLYRVETGNYEYRLILRCRQDARAKFAQLRTDVLEKMELLECKHANDLTKQLRGLLDSLAQLNGSIATRIESLPTLFPIEFDFKETDFQYKTDILEPQKLDDDDDEEEEQHRSSSRSKQNALCAKRQSTAGPTMGDDIVCGLEAVEEPAPILNVPENHLHSKADILINTSTSPENEQLLTDLGLFGIDLNAAPSTVNQVENQAQLTKGSFDFDFFLNQSHSMTSTQLEQDLMATNSLETDLLLQ